MMCGGVCDDFLVVVFGVEVVWCVVGGVCCGLFG